MRAERSHPAPVADGPLRGLKVLDFTWVVAGPMATRMLADFGATVYRIEWPLNPDTIRFMTKVGKGNSPEDTWESSALFNDLNAGKRSITLNMKSERGRGLFLEMLKKADVVVENFSPSAMEKWGLDYEALRKVNERVIYMSLSGYGHTGRSRYYLTYGPSAQALNGLTFASGLPGEEPAGWGFSYMDQTGGYVGALAVLMAVYHRQKTGRGQYLDLSQAETGMALTGAALLDHTVNGRPSRRPGFPPGNRATWPGVEVTSSYRSDPTVAPHNAYPCRGGGANDWCAIACFTDAQWRALAEMVGGRGLVDDPRFLTLAARFENQEALDALIADFTRRHEKYALMERLQAAGIPAGAVQSSQDRVENDPQLRTHGIHVALDHPVVGKRLFQRLPAQMSLTPPRTTRSAPLIGEDNETVLGELIGLNRQEVRDLVAEGVLWPADVAHPDWIDGSDGTRAPAVLAEADK